MIEFVFMLHCCLSLRMNEQTGRWDLHGMLLLQAKHVIYLWRLRCVSCTNSSVCFTAWDGFTFTLVHYLLCNNGHSL